MNPSDPPKEPTPDERLEARIVAWVLGEASAGEAEELVKLCKERPELDAFRREIAALHGMIEASAAAPEGGWKLPAEKRATIEALAGEETVAVVSPKRSSAAIRSVLAVAACLTLALWLGRLMRSPETDELAMEMAASPAPEAAPFLSMPLTDKVRALEEKVEERRKVVANVQRTRASGASRRDTRRDEAIDRSLGPMDIYDAYENLERDERTLARARAALRRELGDDALEAAPFAWMPPVERTRALEKRVQERRDFLARAERMQAIAEGRREEAMSGLNSDLVVQEARARLAEDEQALADLKKALARSMVATKSTSLFGGTSDAPSSPAQPTAKPALSQTMDPIRRGLYMTEGHINLGRYTDARREYEDVLKTDPTNAEARQGMERLAEAQTAHYRAARDHTRAELLMQVDQARELKLPQEESGENPLRKELVETEALAQPVNDWNDMKGLLDEVGPSMPTQPDVHVEAAITDEPEVSPAEEPYSTFSLHVSDVSFRLAEAAIREGERPEPSGVRLEEFYNAVDYGDPAPAPGEKFAGHVEQSAHPVLPGRNLVRLSLKTATAGRHANQPLSLTLLVDQSGSMTRDDRRAALTDAIGNLANLLGERDRVNVIGFSRTPRLLGEGLTGAEAENLRQLVSSAPDEGGTDLEEALRLAGEIAGRHRRGGAENRVVLFTDGVANLGDAEPARLAERVASLRGQGIALDVVGVGTDGLNDALLSEIARKGDGRYAVVQAGDESLAQKLAGAFRPAAQDVKIQVAFNPERVSAYKLLGFEEHRLAPEDFRNDAVDAAELASGEAGIALYQVEVNPSGRGDLGEMTVRFRDPETGEVGERKWAIPYEPAAPVFRQASPSMQLAGLALLAAEELRGGALSEEIQLKDFIPVKASVRNHYIHSRSARRLIALIDAIE